jgi:DNA polymerase III subunit epsilon
MLTFALASMQFQRTPAIHQHSRLQGSSFKRVSYCFFALKFYDLNSSLGENTVMSQEMRFTAIDFETANSSRASACAVGLSLVEGGGIVGRLHQLIRPDPFCFDPFNVSIHGITEEDVSDAPSFAEFWPELMQNIAGPLVAHNASFDMSVLRNVLDESNIPYPEVDYFCTRVIAKLTWPEHPTYALDHLAQVLDIAFEHHDAAEDARACALIALHACRAQGVDSLYDLQDICGLRVGSLYVGGYAICGGPLAERVPGARGSQLRAADIVPQTGAVDATHQYCGMTFAFTGTMTVMQRRDAMQAVVDRGGICHDTVKKNTNYLVLGQKGYIGYRSGHKSSKMKKAEQVLAKGFPIEILSETDFVSLL